MKKNFLTYAVILFLCVMGGCSKDDDGPSKGSNVEGNVKVDGNNINLRYGYAYYGSDHSEYTFSDINLLKYIDEDFEDVDVEYSALAFYYDDYNSEIEDVAINYKINEYRETGYFYEYEEDDADSYVTFSQKNNNVSFSSRSIPMEGYKVSNDKHLGTFNASFSVNGKVKDISDLIDDDYSTRSIAVVEVTDTKQIAFLRSIFKKHSKNTDIK